MIVEKRRRRGGLVGPVILIALGILFLLSNLGLLGWGVWEVIIRLWPILLIAVGLDILVGRGSIWASALVVVVVLAIAAAAVLLLGPVSATGVSLTTEKMSQSLDGATRGDVEIGAGIGTLRIAAMPESDGLIEGTVALAAGEKTTRDFR